MQLKSIEPMKKEIKKFQNILSNITLNVAHIQKKLLDINFTELDKLYDIHSSSESEMRHQQNCIDCENKKTKEGINIRTSYLFEYFGDIKCSVKENESCFTDANSKLIEVQNIITELKKKLEYAASDKCKHNPECQANSESVKMEQEVDTNVNEVDIKEEPVENVDNNQTEPLEHENSLDNTHEIDSSYVSNQQQDIPDDSCKSIKSVDSGTHISKDEILESNRSTPTNLATCGASGEPDTDSDESTDSDDTCETDTDDTCEGSINRMKNNQKSKTNKFNYLKTDNNSDTHKITDLNWIVMQKPLKFPYYPQMGDDVIYLKKEHQLYLKKYSEAISKYNENRIRGKLSDKTDQEKTWEKIEMKAFEHVKVVGISFEMHPTRANLTLRFMDKNKREKYDDFTVKYHDVEEVADFLVLKQIFDRSIRKNWKVNDRIRFEIYQEWHYGTIKSIFDDVASDSVLKRYNIEWDDGSEDDVLNPWDLEEVNSNWFFIYPSIYPIPITTEEYRTLVYQPDRNDWPARDRDAFCSLFLKKLEDLKEISEVKPFFGLNVNLGYQRKVEFPIDLWLIKFRLTNRFYRRQEAVKFDIEYLTQSVEMSEKKKIVIKLKNNQVLENSVPKARAITKTLLTLVEKINETGEPNQCSVKDLFQEIYESEQQNFFLAIKRENESVSASTSNNCKRSSSPTKRKRGRKRKRKLQNIQHSSSNRKSTSTIETSYNSSSSDDCYVIEE